VARDAASAAAVVFTPRGRRGGRERDRAVTHERGRASRVKKHPRATAVWRPRRRRHAD
jgi:hypothetical protein